MAGLYGLSNYSSMFSSGRSNSMDSLYSNLSQYNNIKTGAYKKATKAFYKKQTGLNVEQKGKENSTNTVRKTNKNARMNEANMAISATKNAATELVDSAKKLTGTGKDSLFADNKNYNQDAIFKATSSFVKGYNDMVDALGQTSNSTVINASSSMTRMTNIMSKSLSEIGISVDKDGKMSIDEDTFKNTDMGKVKTMLNGSGSYASMISSSASRVVSQANNQLSLANGGGLYGSSGYYNGYNGGSLYNGYF